MENSNLIAFEGNEIRKLWHEEQWYFSVVDVISLLTESKNPNAYWGKLKEREFQLLTICQQLKLESKDGKKYNTDCANTEGVLRIVMSVPSPKAEPLKLWLAQVGTERIQETENPELGFQRMAELYKAKGYSNEWIDKRMESINTRNKLTEEWKNRDVQEGKEYSILTAIIAKGTFDVTPTEHKNIKGLTKPNQNLRDHMTPIELILTALGEETTRMIAVKQDAQGFETNKEAAIKGGKTAGKARKEVEAATGDKVVSSENYLHLKTGKMDQLTESDVKGG